MALVLVADAELFRLEAMVRRLDVADARLARFRRPRVEAPGDGASDARHARGAMAEREPDLEGRR